MMRGERWNGQPRREGLFSFCSPFFLFVEEEIPSASYLRSSPPSRRESQQRATRVPLAPAAPPSPAPPAGRLAGWLLPTMPGMCN